MTYARLSDARLEQIEMEVRARLLDETANAAQQQHPGHIGREMGLNCFQCGETLKPGIGEVCADCLAENG